MARETVRERKARLERGGDWLRAQRVKRSYSGVEFARRIGVDQAKLSAYENGRYALDVSVARQIAVVLGLSELEVWRGLELPLPRDLALDAMSGPEIVAYVRRTYPGVLEEILGEVDQDPEVAPERPVDKAPRRRSLPKDVTHRDEPGQSASHG